MFTVLLVIYLLIAVIVIGLVLVQQGKSAHVSSSFASGGTGSPFGASLGRVTTVFVVTFLLMSLALDSLSTKKTSSHWERIGKVQETGAMREGKATTVLPNVAEDRESIPE